VTLDVAKKPLESEEDMTPKHDSRPWCVDDFVQALQLRVVRDFSGASDKDVRLQHVVLEEGSRQRRR
jgi:hypothetical protein